MSVFLILEGSGFVRKPESTWVRRYLAREAINSLQTPFKRYFNRRKITQDYRVHVFDGLTGVLENKGKRSFIHTLYCSYSHSYLLNTSSSLRQRNLKTPQSPVILEFCLRKAQAGKSHDYRDVIVFEKLRFQNGFRPH